jgi:DegV family protein with EDD domain
MGIGFQVIAAAEFAAQNQATKEIFRIIEETRRKTRLIAMLDTLEFVHRSGRVGWARARIGSLLRVKPFLEVKNGQVFSLGQTRTRKKGIANLQKYLLSYGPLERIAILHTNAESDAINFMKDVVQNQNLNPLIINVTTIIGTHVGPKGLGFAAVLK